MRPPRARRTGEAPPLTDTGQKLYTEKVELFRGRSIPLEPGEAIENVLEVSKIYDLSAAGIYSIVAQRHVFNVEGNGVVAIESNVVRVKVTPKH